LYKSTVEASKLPTGITMHIAYYNISHQHNIVSNTKPYWDMEEYNNGNYKWEDVFQDEHLVPTISSPLVIFDGVKITYNTKTLELDHIILIYIPKMLDEGTYESTLKLANVYYEEASLYGNKSKQKAQNPHRGFYKNISHGYTSNAGIASGNVVPYHSSKVSVHEEKAFKDIGDKIASNIWRSAIFTFGKKIDHHFQVQASTTNHIYVGLDESPTNICQLHFSKNSFIKPHVDSLDMESSIII
jgi:hypothetical protein